MYKRQPRGTVESALCAAAEQAGLTDPFVQVVALQDFSVLYRIAGSLAEVKHLLTVRSNLRKAVMDVLHGQGLEIASPTLMNQRKLADDQRIAPPVAPAPRTETPTVNPDTPEARVFDKAELAEAIAQTRQQIEQQLADGDDDHQLESTRAQLAELEAQLDASKNGQLRS